MWAGPRLRAAWRARKTLMATATTNATPTTIRISVSCMVGGSFELADAERRLGTLRHRQQRTVMQPRRDDLQTDRQTLAAGAARNRNARHEGEVEQRREGGVSARPH